jgi:DNA transposition AAA+ family ATPase
MVKLSDNVFADTVKSFIEARSWSMGALAKAAGISNGALSQFLAGKYPGDNDSLRAKVENVMTRERDKAVQPKTASEFVETSAAQHVFEVAKYCHLFGDIGVCYSAAGLGKTESVREYARKHSDVILIEANPGYTAHYLFRELRELLGGTSRSNLLDIFVDCCQRLKGSGRLLIVDEAEQLPYKALEMLRRLHDKTGIGVLLTGMPKLLGNLRGLKGEYAQLYSRVGIAYKLQSLSADDSGAIVQMLLPGASAGVVKAFHKESGGITRRLCKIVRRAKYVAKINAHDVDEEVVRLAASLVKMEVMS